ncbi:MAG: YdeI/OmpD-associated family protein [Candidatus Sulfotelmatobacter sp.]
MPSKLHFFSSPSAWRAWLEEHHANTQELWVGLYTRGSGRPSITWPEAVDGALCFGWIDGVRKSVDEISYKIRFTPRKPRSISSAINVRRATELSSMGLMHPVGLAAFQQRQGDRTEIYSYEQRKAAKLTAAFEKEFRAHKAAWKFFQAQAPWYRRTCSFWVISAKKEETRSKRLAALIEHSKHQRTIPALTRTPKAK